MIKVILTGAGFSHNYGAPLAREIGELIFNHPEIQKHDSLKSQFISKLNDFESIYSNILFSNKFNENEQNALLIAVKKAYDVIDNACISPENHAKILGQGLKKFLLHFLNKSMSKKIFFTLNQDLLIERQLYLLIDDEQKLSYQSHLKDEHITNEPIQIKRLGFDIQNIKQHSETFRNDWRLEYKNTMKDEAIKLFDEWCTVESPKICPYVKLHGSYYLYLHNKDTPIMVLGTTKSQSIKEFPIIEYYYENVFKKILEENQCEILIIDIVFVMNI